MTDSVPLEVRRFFRSALNKIAVSNYDVLKEELLQSQRLPHFLARSIVDSCPGPNAPHEVRRREAMGAFVCTALL